MLAPPPPASRLPAVAPARFPMLLAVSLLGLPLAGCRYATEQDCERIIDRIVELELKEQGITDPSLVERRKTETRAKKRDELLGGCVGKRISKSAMTCIDNAEFSKDITEKCLR